MQANHRSDILLLLPILFVRSESLGVTHIHRERRRISQWRGELGDREYLRSSVSLGFSSAFCRLMWWQIYSQALTFLGLMP